MERFQRSVHIFGQSRSRRMSRDLIEQPSRALYHLTDRMMCASHFLRKPLRATQDSRGRGTNIDQLSYMQDCPNYSSEHGNMSYVRRLMGNPENFDRSEERISVAISTTARRSTLSWTGRRCGITSANSRKACRCNYRLGGA